MKAETVPDAGEISGTPPNLRNVSRLHEPIPDADDEAVAAYLLDLMIASRRMAAKRGFSFLAYLIGVAAEESRLLTLGRSAVRQKTAADKG